MTFDHILCNMEGQKRKRWGVDGELDRKRARAKKDDGRKREEPEDAEVEEFFAILRRIHVAVEYFDNGHGEAGRRELTATESVSRGQSPSFGRRDFQGVDGVKVPVYKEVRDTGLDLNADPESEADPVGEHVDVAVS